MYPYEFLEQLTTIADKKRYEVCCEPESKMTGQELFSDFHYDRWREEPAHIRAIHGHPSPNLDVQTFLAEILRMATRNFLSILVIRQMRIQSGRCGGVPQGFDEETKR